MKPPIVLLDVDGPLAKFSEGFVERINKHLGAKFESSQISEWDILKSLGIKNRSDELYSLLNDGIFCAELEVQPGAQEAVEALQKISEVYIVTTPMSSVPDWTHQREAWLKRHFDIASNRVIHTSAKHLVRGDVFVDDRYSNVAEWLRYSKYAFGLLWCMPHNQGHVVPTGLGEEGVIRVKSWQDVIRAVTFYE